MFRAAMCPSSGELLVSIRRLVYVTRVDDHLVRGLLEKYPTVFFYANT